MSGTKWTGSKKLQVTVFSAQGVWNKLQQKPSVPCVKFCLVWGGNRIYTSETALAPTTNPKWDAESFAFDLEAPLLFSKDIDQTHVLELEVRLVQATCDIKNERASTLGAVRFSRRALVSAITDLKGVEMTEPVVAWGVGQNGTLRFRLELVDLQCHVTRCANLASADFFGSSDPYCKVFYGGRYYGRTSTKMDQLYPVWTDEPPFFVPFREDASLLICVFDWDLIGSHDPLGCFRMESDDIATAAAVSLQSGTDADGCFTHKRRLVVQPRLQNMQNVQGGKGGEAGKAGKGGKGGGSLFSRAATAVLDVAHRQSADSQRHDMLCLSSTSLAISMAAGAKPSVVAMGMLTCSFRALVFRERANELRGMRAAQRADNVNIKAGVTEQFVVKVSSHSAQCSVVYRVQDSIGAHSTGRQQAVIHMHAMSIWCPPVLTPHCQLQLRCPLSWQAADTQTDKQYQRAIRASKLALSLKRARRTTNQVADAPSGVLRAAQLEAPMLLRWKADSEATRAGSETAPPGTVGAVAHPTPGPTSARARRDSVVKLGDHDWTGEAVTEAAREQERAQSTVPREEAAQVRAAERVGAPTAGGRRRLSIEEQRIADLLPTIYLKPARCCVVS
jgi:hypothetical protein